MRVTREMLRAAARKVRGSIGLSPKSCDWMMRVAP
jgi:hypothetical protein